MEYGLLYFKSKKKPIVSRNLDEIKNVCKVLFIDDLKFKTVDRLQKNDGWKHARWLKDVESLDQTEIAEAHILFIDVQGVGKKLFPTEEGLGLICAIKKKYPDKKVVMYSAESKGKIDAFHQAAQLVDGRLRKTADHYEFQSTLEKLALDAFGLESCVLRVKEVLYNGFGVSLSKEDIEKRILKLDSGKRVTNEIIGKLFNVQNASAIATIIQLFIDINNPR
jgi:hypothetical protein